MASVAGTPPAKKAKVFGQMLAAAKTPPVQIEEEWDIYYRMCEDIDFLSRANVGGEAPAPLLLAQVDRCG
jgi:hypothetical protein